MLSDMELGLRLLDELGLEWEVVSDPWRGSSVRVRCGRGLFWDFASWRLVVEPASPARHGAASLADCLDSAVVSFPDEDMALAWKDRWRAFSGFSSKEELELRLEALARPAAP